MTIKDDINWRDIRHHNGTDYGGFEELCRQLVQSETQPDEEFIPLGSDKDGGVECYLEFKNGIKWAWQAKYNLDRSIGATLPTL